MNLQKLKDIRIEDYTYELPDERIARFPIENRAQAKLLIYKDGTIDENTFSRVGEHLEAGQTLVYNNTKVIYARIFFRKSTGATIEIFCLEPFTPSDYVSNFARRGSCEWKCLVGNLKKWKEETETLCRFFQYEGKNTQLCAQKLGADKNGEAVIRFTWQADACFSEILDACGEIPIPPYLNRKVEESDKISYQTVYSKEEGSVAAPTAGLHFTHELLARLQQKNIQLQELTLHVGAGTFKPVKSDKIGEHDMHTEHLLVTKDIIKQLLASKHGIIAVGTTTVRTLESIYWMGVKLLEKKADFNKLSQWEAYELPSTYSIYDSLTALLQWFEHEKADTLKALTTIIIVPGYSFKVVDSFFTNFHQPKSTLLLLVAAAIHMDWRKVYDYALQHNFRFLSYGDGSLLTIKKTDERCSNKV
ncbi:S-adenosylmethionine:tRNA ribosyltransferase-isomerase [Bacteroidia bacterium]|nr:S-adenosylmethionine:tRNA ribosyltransferase-isomerase [Bacteroidia bacterium]